MNLVYGQPKQYNIRREFTMVENWTKEKQDKAEQLGAEMTEQIYSIMLDF